MNKLATTLLAIGLVMLVALTRSHHLSPIHLPDFTLVALIIAGVYLRHSVVAIVLIVSAVLLDNYAVFYQGISANCITPAYSFLAILYYLTYYFAKFIPTLTITLDKTYLSTLITLCAIIVGQWLLATVSYYAFTDAPWAGFLAYIVKWSLVEIPTTLYQLIAISFIITLFTYVRRSLSTANATQKDSY